MIYIVKYQSYTGILRSYYNSQLMQLVLGMLIASILQLIFPFLTQSLVDVGIRDGNLSFITLILITQLIIFATRLSVEFIRSWILLHMNTRINTTLISVFFDKINENAPALFRCENDW